MFRQYEFKRYDWSLAVIIILLSVFGIFIIDSATKGSGLANKQIVGLILGIIMLILFSLIDYKIIGKFYMGLYFINIGLLILVKLTGTVVNGSKRWIELPGFNLQPSEFSKLFIVIFVAKMIHNNLDKVNKPSFLVKIGVLVGIPWLLIMDQPDLSTSLVLIFILVVLLFVSKLNYKYFVFAIALAVPILIAFVWYIQQPDQKLLKEYQYNRVMAALTANDPTVYVSEKYQQLNSVQAMGTGGLYGKGLYNGEVKNADFLPEPQTDFIFSVIGEELGFIGCLGVLITQFLIIVKCLWIAKDAQDHFAQLIVVGVASIIAFQTFVNIGVVTMLLPNTGIPLPFVSYGLSSLVTMFASMGIVLNISMQRYSKLGRGYLE